MTTRAIMVAAPRSGAGKTTVTLALLAALRRRGIAVRAAKSGPDYIDPAFHQAATGAPSLNLDSWAMPAPLLDATLASASHNAEILVIESAMGLFDGLSGPQGASGCAADLAARWGIPVLLVLDASGQSQSAAATAHGFATFLPGLGVAGVVLNRLASDRHHNAIAAALQIPLRGALRRDAAVAVPERHLGLVQAREQGELPALLNRLADIAEAAFDIDAILADAAPLPPLPATAAHALPPPGQRIAIADDAAFSFFYAHLAASWRASGATLHPFSPLADEAPPDDCDACWLPGGYPELHAAALAHAANFKAGLAHFATTRPVHGECGGYMVLGATLQDADGNTHDMANLLGHATSFAKRRMNLGYRSATLLHPTALGPANTVLRGHEFHYANVTTPGTDDAFATVIDGQGKNLGPAGGRRGHVTGSFFHAIARQEA